MNFHESSDSIYIYISNKVYMYIYEIIERIYSYSIVAIFLYRIYIYRKEILKKIL